MAPAASVPAPISPQVRARAISSATMNACSDGSTGPPAVLDRPRLPEVAGRVQPGHPGAQRRHLLGIRCAHPHVLARSRPVPGDEGPDLGPVVLQFGAVVEAHGRLLVGPVSAAGMPGSWGNPRTCSATVFSWISRVPAPMVEARVRRKPCSQRDRWTACGADLPSRPAGPSISTANSWMSCSNARDQQPRDRRGGAGLALGQDVADGALGVVADDADPDFQVDQPVTDQRVGELAAFAGELFELGQHPAVHRRLVQGAGRPLVPEAGARQRPAAVLLADPVGGRHPHVVEEHLGEQVPSGEVTQRPDLRRPVRARR